MVWWQWTTRPRLVMSDVSKTVRPGVVPASVHHHDGLLDPLAAYLDAMEARIRALERRSSAVRLMTAADAARYTRVDVKTIHGSPPNEREDAQRRSIISHMISTDTRWNPEHPHPIYSRYRRPGEEELDEAFFPILWLDGYRTPWLSEYAATEVAA
jgi:hypothetical protein